jgi:hypothetical protein
MVHETDWVFSGGTNVGTHSPSPSPAAVPRRAQQDYMQMRSDDMFNL